MLSAPLRARVLLVDYRLAPEHRFPAALEDCVTAVRGVIASGTRPHRLGLIGDSCGGGLVVSTLLRLRDAGDPLPALGVTLGGWFDLEATGEAAVNPTGVDPFIDPEWLRRRGRDYVGQDGDPRDPLASPIHANLADLPPLFLQVGQIDVTRDDATRLATRAARQGVAVTLDVWPQMIHGFQGLAAAGLPEAVAALEQVGAFVRARIPD
jgi:acetyl esterase/lipase